MKSIPTSQRPPMTPAMKATGTFEKRRRVFESGDPVFKCGNVFFGCCHRLLKTGAAVFESGNVCSIRSCVDQCVVRRADAVDRYRASGQVDPGRQEAAFILPSAAGGGN